MTTPAEQARDEAIARVRKNLTEKEMENAVFKVFCVADKQASFTTDDIDFKFPADVERRVIGAVMQQAARMGICEPTDRMRKSNQVRCHARPKAIWRSLVPSE